MFVGFGGGGVSSSMHEAPIVKDDNEIDLDDFELEEESTHGGEVAVQKDVVYVNNLHDDNEINLDDFDEEEVAVEGKGGNPFDENEIDLDDI